MADLLDFIKDYNDRRLGDAVARNFTFQFGLENNPLMLARYLPLMPSSNNVIEEDLGRLEGALIAGDGEALSPPQMKQSAGGGSVTVKLGHIDTARQMNAREMQRLGQLLDANDTARAEAFYTNFLLTSIRIGMELKAEKQRAEILCDAQVTVQYLNQSERTIDFPNLRPSGSRVTVPSGTEASPAGWYNDTYDPLEEDILPKARELKAKGYRINAIIGSSYMIDSVLGMNKKIQERAGGQTVINTTNGQLETYNRGLGINGTAAGAFTAVGLPVPMTYDSHYRTQTARNRIFPENKLLMLCTTGRDQELYEDYLLDDGSDIDQQIITDTFGYYGVGVSAGQTSPGAVITSEYKMLKPVGVYAEGYREGFPVLQEPEAIVCFTVDRPTP